MMSFPLYGEEQDGVVTGINFYSTQSNAFTPWAQTVGLLLATHGALAVANALTRRRNADLSRALVSNRVRRRSPTGRARAAVRRPNPYAGVPRRAVRDDEVGPRAVEDRDVGQREEAGEAGAHLLHVGTLFVEGTVHRTGMMSSTGSLDPVGSWGRGVSGDTCPAGAGRDLR
jgi:hypothetical protein